MPVGRHCCLQGKGVSNSEPTFTKEVVKRIKRLLPSCRHTLGQQLPMSLHDLNSIYYLEIINLLWALPTTNWTPTAGRLCLQTL